MSTSRSPQGTPSPTRQQLDELDSLLQRMLDLPVNQVEDDLAASEEEGLTRASSSPASQIEDPPALPRTARHRSEVPERLAERLEGNGTKRPSSSIPPGPQSKLSRPVKPVVSDSEPITPRVHPPQREPRDLSPPTSEAGTETVSPEGPIDPSPASLAPRLVQAPEPSPTEKKSPLPVQPPHNFRGRVPPAAEEVSREQGDQEADDWVPLRSSWQPSPQTWPPLAESWQQARQVPEKARIRHDEPAAIPAAEAQTPAPHDPPQLAAPATALLPEPAVPIYQEPAPEAAGPAIKPQDPGPEEPRDRPTSRSEPQPVVRAGPAPPAWSADRPAVATDPAPIPPPPPAPPLEPSPTLDTPPIPGPLLPLVWLNLGFDAILSLAGPLGRWLCGRMGRNWLGLLGILCLSCTAALLLACWLGWTW